MREKTWHHGELMKSGIDTMLTMLMPTGSRHLRDPQSGIPGPVEDLDFDGLRPIRRYCRNETFEIL